jgi:hypothetical protein
VRLVGYLKRCPLVLPFFSLDASVHIQDIKMLRLGKNLPPLFIVIDLLVSFVHEHVVGLHAAGMDTYLLAHSHTGGRAGIRPLGAPVPISLATV